MAKNYCPRCGGVLGESGICPACGTTNEAILLLVKSSALRGGGLVSRHSVTATNRSLRFKDPKMFGLRSDITEIPYNKIDSIKKKGGLRGSTLILNSGTFGTIELGGISGGDADKIIAIYKQYTISPPMTSAQKMPSPATAPAPQKTPSPAAAPAPSNGDTVLLEAEGVYGQKLQLLPTKVRIIRKTGVMSLALHGVTGDKEIYVDQISSIQFKKAGMAVGYIQFSFLGGQETKRGIGDAMQDENTVPFNAKQQAAFEAIKQAIEQKIHDARSGRMQQPLQQQVPQPVREPAPQKEDPMEQLSKLKIMVDAGLINEEDYNTKKAEILAKM